MIWFEIEWQGHPIDLMERGMKQAVREGLKAGVEYWHKHFAPLHFKPEAYARYGYRKRRPGREAEKYRRFGHHDPLTFSRMAKRMILLAIRVTAVVRGDKRTAIGRMQAPAYFGRICQEELTETTAEEERTIEAVIYQRIETRMMAAMKRKRRERIK